MEKFKVVGRQYMKFTAKDGNKIEGIRLHCISQPRDNVEGSPVEQLFCSVNRNEFTDLNTISLPMTIEVEFNRFGKPESYKISKKE